jgi:hypothetical protein
MRSILIDSISCTVPTDENLRLKQFSEDAPQGSPTILRTVSLTFALRVGARVLLTLAGNQLAFAPAFVGK